MPRALLFTATLSLVTLAGAASAQEYTCFDRRSGAVAGHPVSMDEARKWEDRNPALDCRRKGAPVTSDRDRDREQRREERREQEERYGDRRGDWGDERGGDAERPLRTCRSSLPYGSVIIEAAWEDRHVLAVRASNPGGGELLCRATRGGELLDITRARRFHGD